MINLRETLDKLYLDKKAESLIVLLEKHSLFDPFKKAEIQLNELIKNQANYTKTMLCVPVGSLAANLILSVNSRLQKINYPKRNELEQILSDLSIKLLEQLIRKITFKKKELVFQIGFALEKSCEFHGYDKFQLIEYLKLDTIIAYTSTLKKGEKVLPASGEIPSLVWNESPQKFNLLKELFFDQEFIRKRTGFDKLFHAPDKELQINLNEQKADLILQLFSHLKSRKKISHRKCSSIYDALRYHVLDFQEKILKGKLPKDRINVLKNSKLKWATNQRLIDNLLEGIF